MKKNISISVLFGLALAFGMLIASCDNGVLPDLVSDPNHWENDIKKNPGAAAAYYVDFVNNDTGAVGFDGIADYDAKGKPLTLTADEAAKLIAKTDEEYFNPKTGVKHTIAYTPGTLSGGDLTGEASLTKVLTPSP